MSNGTKNVLVTIASDGSCSVSDDPIRVSNSNGGTVPTLIVWTITGGQFQDPGGIVLKTPWPGPPYAAPFVAGNPSGNATRYQLVNLNNVRATAGTFPYTVNYIWNDQNKSFDPVIENEPPTGGPMPRGGRP